MSFQQFSQKNLRMDLRKEWEFGTSEKDTFEPDNNIFNVDPNVRVKQILIINSHQLAIIQNYMIHLYQISTNTIVYTLKLDSHQHEGIQFVVYCHDFNMFYALVAGPKQVIALTNTETNLPTTNAIIYDFESNKAKSNSEWQSRIQCLQKSRQLLLIRKFGCDSLVVLINLHTNQISWQFYTNQECLSGLDNEKYLIDYRQHTTKHYLTFTLFHIFYQQFSHFQIIDQAEPSITRQIKLLSKDTKNQEILSILVAIDTKNHGYKIILASIRFQNHMIEVTHAFSQQNQLAELFLNETESMIYCLQNVINKETGKSRCLLRIYKVLMKECKMLQLNEEEYEGNFGEERVYSPVEGLMIEYENIYKRHENGNIDVNEGSILQITITKILKKQFSYAFLMEDYMGGMQELKQLTLDLLS